MDKKTFDGLKTIIVYLKLVHVEHGLEEEIRQVIGWMDEIEKEVD